MKYLPFENTTLHTQLSADEILRRLNEDILPFDSFSWRGHNPDNKVFQGYTINKEFYINKTFKRYNTTPAIIKGELQENETETIINLKARLDKIHGIFTIGLFAMFFILVVYSLNISTLCLAFLLLMLVYIPAMSSFKRDSKDAKAYLANLFEAEIKTS